MSELVKDIVDGVYTSAELTTELTNVESRWQFIQDINTPFFARILFDKTSSLNVLFGSVTAKSLILESSVALFVIASNELATRNIFSVADLAKEALTNAAFFDAYRTNFDNYKRLKRMVNKSKLKQAVFKASGTLSVNNMIAYSALAIGAGSTGFTSGLDQTGAGGEVKAVSQILSMTDTLTINVGIPANVGGAGTLNSSTIVTSTPTTLISAQGGLTAGLPDNGGGTDSGGGLNNLSDLDILNAPWQFYNCSAKGGGSKEYSSSLPYLKGGLGGKYYDDYGRGSSNDNTQPDGKATYGLIIINYIET